MLMDSSTSSQNTDSNRKKETAAPRIKDLDISLEYKILQGGRNSQILL